MVQPAQSPQIRIRQTATPPRFAGLTLPSALRELCTQPENSKPKPTPRRTEMSALATRLRKIQLDTSPTDKRSTHDVQPSRLDFDNDDDDVDKENITEKTIPIGITVWGVHDKKEVDEVKERHEVDTLEQAARKMSSQLPGKPHKEKEGILGEKELIETEAHVIDERSKTEPSNDQNSSTASLAGIETTKSQDSEEAGAENAATVSLDFIQSEGNEMFERNLQRVLDGKNKWPWLERCKAMSSVAESLSNNPSQELVNYIESVLNSLSFKLNDHLDELRPSVITSALGLVNAIISLNVESASNFAEEVFPSIMDLACGRSLTAQEAAKSLALFLHHHSELQSILGDADNIDRLRDILQQQATTLTNADFRERAGSALELAKKVTGDANGIRNSPEVKISPGASNTPSQEAGHSPQSKTSLAEEDKISRMESPQVRNSSFFGRVSGKSPATSARNSVRRLHRTSGRLSRTPSTEGSQPGSPSTAPRVGEVSVEVRNGATVIRNTKLRGSGRKHSPGTVRKQRIYTDEEVEELRRKAIQAAKQEASTTYEEEREDLMKSRDELERKLKVENSQVAELKAVLEEYQLTMQTMVAQGNTQVNAQHISLVNEKNRLKAELLEVSEAFEKLKEKYDDSKKTVDLFEAKETRFIAQIKELKKNMVELQKWSNDLKANTEKKLSKAFESVTSYRSSFIDKEAHAQKAISDLERTRGELEREQQSHTETAAKFSSVEAQLHSEQDARSCAEASLASVKATLSRISSHKDRLQSELDNTKDTLAQAKAKLLELENKASRVSEIQSQLDSVVVENQSLKARAYDDMTQIKSLEAVVREKDAELDEMSAICEEAMERLERGKPS